MIEKDQSFFNSEGADIDVIRNWLIESSISDEYPDQKSLRLEKRFFENCDIYIPAATEGTINEEITIFLTQKLFVRERMDLLPHARTSS